MPERERHADEFTGVLGTILPSGAPVALLDFPYYDNPGDAAIWKGENLALAELGNPVVYTASQTTFDRRRLDRLLPTEGVVLITGGGNLGDLWPWHQTHREAVIASLPNRTIVQLPQTVGFEDERAGDDALARLAVHPDLTVMARDRRSLERLVAAGLNARLSSDPTTALWPDDPPTHEPTGPGRVLYLLRSDHERRLPIPLPMKSVARDWADLGVNRSIVSRPSHVLDRSLDVIDRTQKHAGRALPASCRARIARQRRHSDRLVAAATAAILACDVVVTDRLHGMLFALAHGRHVVGIDSGYGKLDTYARDFLVGNRLLHRVDAFDEVNHIIERLTPG